LDGEVEIMRADWPGNPHSSWARNPHKTVHLIAEWLKSKSVIQ